MANFNPLLESKVAQFDAKHGLPVLDDEGGWLIYGDGSSRKLTPGQYDFVEAADQPADVTAKWRKFWCKKMIVLLAERFGRQQDIALRATGVSAARELEALRTLHDQLVTIKQTLDDLNNADAPAPQLDCTTWYDCRPSGVLLEGMTPIATLELAVRNLERSCDQIRRELDHVTSSPLTRNDSKVGIWEERLEARLERLHQAKEAVRLQREWQAKPLEERQAIAREVLQAGYDEYKAAQAARQKHLAAVRSLSVAFVDDEAGLQTPEQKRLAEDQQREDVIRQESSEWLSSRMGDKERKRNEDVEHSARDEFAEAVAERDKQKPRGVKKAKKKPKAKKARR